MTREVITVNVGGAGVRIGDAVTKQYMSEHNIKKDGTSDSGEPTFFEETRSGQFVPRQVSVDLDPTTIDALRDGELARIYHPEFLLNGKEDAANNFARGHYTVGKEILDQVNDRLRKLVDNCENVQGFIINHSLGGGTGSGLGSLILERLAVDYRKKAKIGFEVLAGDCSGRMAPCQAYNQLLGTHWLTDHTEVSLVFDNRQLSRVCRAYGVKEPTYEHVNSLIARIASGATISLRDRDSELNSDLNELQTNLVPFPRLHFMTSSFSGNLQKKATKSDVKALTVKAIEASNMVVGFNHDFDPVEDKYMALQLCYRGPVKSRDANETVQSIKTTRKVNFVEWCPTGVKVDMSRVPVGEVEGNRPEFDFDNSVTMIGNNVAMSREFAKNSKKYDMMYAQRAYVNQYVAEGMEEGELSEAREDLGFLEKDYLDVVTEQASDEDDDDDDF